MVGAGRASEAEVDSAGRERFEAKRAALEERWKDALADLSAKDCVLLCWFHHQVVIHRWGWTLVVNPDGTTTAWNKNKTKVLHSHGPPARAG